jgi:hypothetical protein
MKKYELTAEKKINWFGRELFQIRALISFETITGEEVEAGDLGGYVESENNLSHDEKAWLSGNAEVWGNAKVWGNAEVSGNAKVSGNAEVFSTNHIFELTPIGANANSVTFFRTKNREIEVSYEFDLYTLGGFEQLISNWLDKFKMTARLAVEIAKTHIYLTEEPPFGKCPTCDKEFNSELISEYAITYCPWCGTEIEG